MFVSKKVSFFNFQKWKHETKIIQIIQKNEIIETFK
jgi:hypothetical protein